MSKEWVNREMENKLEKYKGINNMRGKVYGKNGKIGECVLLCLLEVVVEFA